jgi:crotonobetaine/carnitine-CoA ligase
VTFPSTIIELFEWRAAAAPPRHWLWFESDTWSFADATSEIDRIAVGLAERGVVAGDRVAFLTGNHPQTIFGWFAANRLGAIFAPWNPQLKTPEIRAQAELVTPRLVVFSEPHRELANGAGVAPVTADELSRAGTGSPRASVDADDVAVLIATSGTTGRSKAVAQTHRTFALTAESFPSWLGLSEADRLMTSLPLFHINAQAYSVLASLACGAGLALLPKFSASRFFTEAKRFGATEVNAVGALVRILAQREPTFAERDHSLRLCYTALALPEAEHRELEERFGFRMSVGYGLSECTFGTIWPRDEAPRYGAMGKLRQHPRLGVMSHAQVLRDNGSLADADEPGELLLKNPCIMRGYWNAPEETAEVLRDGWLRTGDLVRRDADGWYTFVSRKKDVLRRRGENVAAAEIENVLCRHPSVAEAAAVARPSSLGEDEIVAFVAPRAGQQIDVAALLDFASEQLADFKVPSEIFVRDRLPRTATERIAKHLLR